MDFPDKSTWIKKPLSAPAPPPKPPKRFATRPEGLDSPELETEVVITTATNKTESIAERRAKRLLDRVKTGEKLSRAATAERMTVRELRDPENPVRASLEQLVGQYFLPPEARKQMVRAGLNKMFIENVNSEDPASKKIALDAAKQIGSDPEVGLNTEMAGGVIINIQELDSVFKQLQSFQPPEIQDGRDIRQIESGDIEGEFDDIKDIGSEPDALPGVSG